MQKKWKFWGALAALGVLTAHANMSTAMESASMLHGMLLNPIVAILEAALITLLWRVRFPYALLTMLGANYLSFFIGYLLNRPLSRAVGYPFYTLFGDATWYWSVALPLALLLAIGVMYGLTVLVETALARLVSHSWRDALRRMALVNGVSAIGMLGYYLYWSDFDFLRLPKEPNAEFVQTAPATIYFVDLQGRLCTVSPQGGEVTVIDESRGRIVEGISRQVVRSAEIYRVVDEQWALLLRSHGMEITFKTPYPPSDLRQPKPLAERAFAIYPDWREEPSPYKVQPTRLDGIIVSKDDQELFRIRMNLPHDVDPGQEDGFFIATNPNVLPGDYVVYEFGCRVMITHLPTRRTAKLADGYAPITMRRIKE
ncbi:MAG: hypothetical protein N2554_03560 [Fimbriimonadales bacterium]|nr:hypothetical protein [Fimbriimonadales bacterium]